MLTTPFGAPFSASGSGFRQMIIGDPDFIPVGFLSQSILGFAWLTDPRDEQYWIYTLGAWQLLGTFRMHTVNNPALIPGTYPDVFSQGHNPANAGLLWGVVGGLRSVAPTTSFSPLYFSPNAAPTWTTVEGTRFSWNCAGCFEVLGADTDLDNTLTITLVEGPGTFTQTDAAMALPAASCAMTLPLTPPTSSHSTSSMAPIMSPCMLALSSATS